MAKPKMKFNTVGESEANQRDLGNRKKFTTKDLVSFTAKTENQQNFFDYYYSQTPVISLKGFAGVGKTAIAFYAALTEVLDESTVYDKIVMVRSAVESRKMGFLPGDLDEKAEAYEAPYRALTEQFITYKTAYDNLKALGYYEFLTTSYLRGITLDNAVIIVEECFEGNTEVLTEKGFVKFKDLQVGDKVGQVIENRVEFVEPMKYIQKDYKGEMSEIRTGRFSLAATKNHDFVYYDGKNNIIKEKAGCCPKSNWKVKTSVDMTSDSKLSKTDEAEIIYLCALQADGHYQKTVHSNGHSSYNWVVQFSRSDKIKKFDECLDTLGIKHSKSKEDKNGRVRYYLGKRNPIGLEITQDKNFIFEDIIQWSAEKQKFFIKESWEWDGSVKGNTPLYCSTNYNNVIVLQTLGHLFGYRCRIMETNDSRDIFKKTPKTGYRLTFVETDKITLQKAKHRSYQYEGEVYCVTVPSGKIMVRHEGNICVTGNCQNLDYSELHTIMTRVGLHSRIIFTGDSRQDDLKRQREKSGFEKLHKVLNQMPYGTVGVVEFTVEDVVRSGIVKDFLIADSKIGED